MAKKEVVAKKSFMIQARIIVDTAIEIQANDLLEAMEEAKAMKKENFLELEGDDHESDMRITGIFETSNGDAKL